MNAMKPSIRTLFASLFLLMAGKGFAASTGELSKPNPKNNDSIINASKSNDIVIFKMLPTPVTNNTGSLKKAGKVARTSNSRT